MQSDSDMGRVSVSGRSGESGTAGLYWFEATVDGLPIELHVCEDVAFDLLQAWTPSHPKCLEILRVHRGELARALEQKIRRGYWPGQEGWCLNADDVSWNLRVFVRREEESDLRFADAET